MVKRLGEYCVIIAFAAVSVRFVNAQNLPPATNGKSLPQDTVALNVQQPHSIMRGMASWYGRKFQGRKTASGERFNRRDFTCASPTLPFGSLVRVTNDENGKSVIVRVNDRGPFVDNRVIDLSYAAACEIGMKGCAGVSIEPCPTAPQDMNNVPADILAEGLPSAKSQEKKVRRAVRKPLVVDTLNLAVAPPDTTVISPIKDIPALPDIAKVPVAGRFADANVMTASNELSADNSGHVIMNYHGDIEQVHGFTVFTAGTHDYSAAGAIRDALLARGYRSVYLVARSIAGESQYAVCVGLEPVAIACRLTAESLKPDYPQSFVTYIENISHDPNQTTASAN